MKTTVFLTDLDIRGGLRFLAYQCPLALAINRVIDRDVGVGATTWWFKESPYVEYQLPDTAIAFRELFDNKKKVIPFVFEVDDDEMV